MHSRSLLLIMPASALLMLAACTKNNTGGNNNTPATPVPSTNATQESAASSSAMLRVMDAGNDALIKDATAPSGEAVIRDADNGVNAAAAIHNRFVPKNAVTLLVDITLIRDIAGNKKYPNTTGKFTITTDGAVVASWPAGSSTVSSHAVTIAFDQGPVVSVDPDSGLSATLSGTFQYHLDTNYTHTATDNWMLTLDSTVSIPSSSPLTVTLVGAGGQATSSLYGYRRLHAGLTRVKTTTVDTIAYDSSIDGNATGVDPAAPSDAYTDWHYKGPAHSLIWNRNAHFAFTYDFKSPTPFLLTALSDKIFLVIDGQPKVGPYTLGQVATTYHLRQDGLYQ